MNTPERGENHPVLLERLERAIREQKSFNQSTMDPALDAWLIAYNRTIEDDYSSDERMLISALVLSTVAESIRKTQSPKAAQ